MEEKFKRYKVLNANGNPIGNLSIIDEVPKNIMAGNKLLLGGSWTHTGEFLEFTILPIAFYDKPQEPKKEKVWLRRRKRSNDAQR